MLACHTRFLTSTVENGPTWPEYPDRPQVLYKGEVRPRLGGWLRPYGVSCEGRKLAVADADTGLVWAVDLTRRRGRRFASLQGPMLVDGIGKQLLVTDPNRGRLFTAPRAIGWRRLKHKTYLERPLVARRGPDGRILVVDPPAHRIYVGALDEEGRRLALEPIGPGRGEVGEGFNFPVDAIWSPGGDIFVADGLNAAVQRLDPDGKLSFVAGGVGVGGGALVRPKGLAFDAQGRLHVVDAGMQHVQVYDPQTGRLLGRYGGPGDGPGQLALPAGICIAGDRAYVADSLNRRIQVYELLQP